jgi:hypothetical protein
MCQNIYIEALFESPTHLFRTTFETLKYIHVLKLLFEKGTALAAVAGERESLPIF